MSAPTCMLCKRPVAWRVGNELLCELHKEQAIERFGVDRFPIVRVADKEEKFLIRGRYKANSRVKVPTHKRTVQPHK